MQNTGLILRFSYLDYGNQRCQIDQWTQNKLNYSFLKTNLNENDRNR